MTDVPAKPLPEMSGLTRPFWEAARNGELRMQKCDRCGHVRFPVNPVCTECLSPEHSWTRLSGRGTVLAHLVFHQVYHRAWTIDVPYSVIMVQLEEGPRMFSDIEDPERRYVDADLVGHAVEVQFRRLSPEVTLPWFRPVS
jgi:uncharacterized OB-fold protein